MLDRASSGHRLPPDWSFVAGVAVLALLVGAAMIRPWDGVPIAYDTAASVIHFDRIIRGIRLEAALSTTPKPLLTLIDGTLYSLTHDWAAIAWSSIIAFSAAVTLTAWLVLRVDGPLGATFTAIGLMVCVPFLEDVALSLAVAWALVCWALAGHLTVGRRPRWGLVGIALLLGTLARIETLLIVGLAALVLVGQAVVSRSERRGWADSIPAGPWSAVAIAALAIPVMCVHDALLTGDPFFWAGVAARYSAQTLQTVPGAMTVAHSLLGRLVAVGGLTVLAVLGTVRLASTARTIPIAVGAVALGPVLAAALVTLAARGIYVTMRYAIPLDIALVVAAAFGLGALRVHLAAADSALRGMRANRSFGVLAAIAVGAGLAVVLSGGAGPFDRGLRLLINDQQALGRDLEAARPALEQALAAVDPRTARPEPVLLVPVPARPRLALDLGLPLTAIGSTNPSSIGTTVPVPGQLVFHDRAGDPASPAYAPFESTTPTVVGDVELRPIANDPVAGWWLTKAAAASSTGSSP